MKTGVFAGCFKRILMDLLFTGLVIFVVITGFARSVYSAELLPIDAVLVLDVSRSMRTADPYRISRDAMNLFVDKLTEGRDRVGIVAYAGNVEASLGLVDVHKENNLHEFIAGLEYASWTDHGVGLLEAVRILSEDFQGDSRQGVIVFLTDGNMNVNPWGTRTNEMAQEDVYAAISQAREKNVPIHTIGLNFDGNLAVDYINNIADATLGLSFETADAENLPEIINAFFHAMTLAPQVRIEEEIFNEEILEEEIFEEPYEVPAILEEPEEIHAAPPEILQPPEEFNEVSSENSVIVAIIIGALSVAIGILLLAKLFAPKRVFTGKLVLEVVDAETRISNPPLFRNLIEHGRRVTLARLLGNTEKNSALNSVIFTPCPAAPSHLPQLLIKCKNPGLKFAKDFVVQDVSRGLSINIGTEMTVETENKQIRLQYCDAN
ncbi:MAG: VWA domain-containing protein [Defluviitaleaceae bacterium]|nr:VWA domain-containing protein [Defluviitaleaceae bacterium]